MRLRSTGFARLLDFVLDFGRSFLYGFPKIEADNITPNALKGFRKIPADLMAVPEEQMEILLAPKELREIERSQGDLQLR